MCYFRYIEGIRLGCIDVGGVGGEWVRSWNNVWESGVVLCLCEL